MSDRVSWHLCWQAAYGHSFLAQPALASWVRQRVIDAHRLRSRVLLDFVILPCEVHTLSGLHSEDDTVMLAREVGSIVARRLRRYARVDGPALRGRYLSHWIESDDDLRAEMRMMAWRPVVAGMCRSPTYHAHGAFPIALGRSSVDGFDARPLLSLFGVSVSDARQALRRFVLRRPSPEQLIHWELTRGYSSVNACMERVLHATSGPRADAAARLIAAGGAGLDGGLTLLEGWVGQQLPDDIGMSGAAADRQRGARARALIACLAVDHGLCSAAELARRFGRSKSTLSEQMAACRRRPPEAMLLETPVQQIILEVLGRDTLRRLP